MPSVHFDGRDGRTESGTIRLVVLVGLARQKAGLHGARFGVSVCRDEERKQTC